jgi:hypothetical protein
MGLFSFKKKSDQTPLSPPEMPNFGNQTHLSDRDFMPRPEQDMSMTQIPPPPPGMLPSIGTEEQPMPQQEPEPMHSQDTSKNTPLPAFDFSPEGQSTTPQPTFPMVQEPAFAPRADFTLEKPQGLPQLPEVEVKKRSVDWTKEDHAQKEEEFELPDFDDEELKKIQGSAAREQRRATAPAPKIDFTIEEPAKFVPKKQETPAPEKKTLPPVEIEKKTQAPQERYIDLATFFDVRDQLTAVRTIARGVEEEMFAQNYKEKLDNYAQLASCLGAIQDRLMLVESKIFDNRKEEF